MIEKRDDEWYELEAKARQMLENSQFFPKDETIKHFIPTLHLWITPSFTPEKHWVFYDPRPQLNPLPKPRVRQFVWKKQEDYKRLNDPLIGLKEGFHSEPTFEIKTIEIERENFKRLHEDLAEIHFPAFIKDDFLGLDGEHFGVETLGAYHKAKVSWWSAFPPEWKNLVDWYKKIREFLEREFNEC